MTVCLDLKVWKHCKEGDWAVVCMPLHMRIKTGEIFWIGQIKEFGFKTDPDTKLREELLKVVWYEWEEDKGVYEVDVSTRLLSPCSVFFLYRNPTSSSAINPTARSSSATVCCSTPTSCLPMPPRRS